MPIERQLRKGENLYEQRKPKSNILRNSQHRSELLSAWWPSHSSFSVVASDRFPVQPTSRINRREGEWRERSRLYRLPSGGVPSRARVNGSANWRAISVTRSESTILHLGAARRLQLPPPLTTQNDVVRDERWRIYDWRLSAGWWRGARAVLR